jgi:asparagine synthetase B (glutamine-hydrolysing)
MCGIYYSTCKDSVASRDNGLKRRGPEGWFEEDNDLGHMAYSMLSTIGQPTSQPVKNHKGMLLYNGSTYNQQSNDAKWISENLSGNIDSCIDFIRTLIGEYAIIWNTDSFTIFCSDVFSIRPLYFFYDEMDIFIASLPESISCYPAQYKCEGNKIYVYDKKTKKISIIDNKHFDLSQTDSNYDKVFDAFELAVKDRHTDKNMYTVSGGYDTGAIACCVEKNIGEFNGAFVIPNGEDKKVLAERAQRHKLKPVHFKDSEKIFSHTEIDKILHGRNYETDNSYATYGLSSIILNLMKPRQMKIMVVGSGGDEVYADYGFGGKSLDWYKTSGKRLDQISSKFGGHFPVHLELVWPWHNYAQYQSSYIEKHEAVGGYWGIEMRCPMLDVRLVQAWLNTKHTLKNCEYKGWMAQYMSEAKYPFDRNGRKTIFAY